MQKIKKLVIGSKNKAKISEWKKFLKDSFEVLTLKDLSEESEVEETGETFFENARLKASHYAKKLGEYVFAEDGGFEIDILGGAPGVHSRRILPGKKEASDEEIVNYVLDRLKGVPKEKRVSRLKVAVAISDPEGNIIFEDSGSLEGYVLEDRDNSPIIEGYPYRNLLFIPELSKTYAQASDEDHEKINHKRVIAEKIKSRFKNSSSSKG
jgi:XTP/dITP diphosphohydrolase